MNIDLEFGISLDVLLDGAQSLDFSNLGQSVLDALDDGFFIRVNALEGTASVGAALFHARVQRLLLGGGLDEAVPKGPLHTIVTPEALATRENEHRNAEDVSLVKVALHQSCQFALKRRAARC